VQALAAGLPDDWASDVAQTLLEAIDALDCEHAQVLPARTDPAMAAEFGAEWRRSSGLPAG
jgi:hypothetical protein